MDLKFLKGRFLPLFLFQRKKIEISRDSGRIPHQVCQLLGERKFAAFFFPLKIYSPQLMGLREVGGAEARRGGREIKTRK